MLFCPQCGVAERAQGPGPPAPGSPARGRLWMTSRHQSSHQPMMSLRLTAPPEVRHGAAHRRPLTAATPWPTAPPGRSRASRSASSEAPRRHHASRQHRRHRRMSSMPLLVGLAVVALVFVLIAVVAPPGPPAPCAPLACQGLAGGDAAPAWRACPRSRRSATASPTTTIRASPCATRGREGSPSVKTDTATASPWTWDLVNGQQTGAPGDRPAGRQDQRPGPWCSRSPARIAPAGPSPSTSFPAPWSVTCRATGKALNVQGERQLRRFDLDGAGHRDGGGAQRARRGRHRPGPPPLPPVTTKC